MFLEACRETFSNMLKVRREDEKKQKEADRKVQVCLACPIAFFYHLKQVIVFLFFEGEFKSKCTI